MWTNKPAVWGPLHIASFALAAIILVVGFILGKKYEDEKYDKKKDFILTIYGFALVALEIFKEIFIVATTHHYDLTLIPFQLCSTPMYLLPFVMFVKNKTIKSGMLGYIAFVAIIAAFFYFVKPVAMLNADYVIISFQSIIWHESLLLCASFTMTGYRMVKKGNFRTLLAGVGMFVFFVVIAIVLNLALHNVNPSSELNLFYISYYNINYVSRFNYPILSLINKTQRPYVLYILEYIVYIFLGMLMFYGLGFGANYLIDKIKTKKTN